MIMDTQAQLELEELFHKNQILTRLRTEFGIPEIVAYAEDHQIPAPFAIDLLVQMVLHKRATVGTLVGLLCQHFSEGENQLQECADLLFRSYESGLVGYDNGSAKFIIMIDVNQNVYDDLERYQYPLPMVVEPGELRSNRDTGYLGIASRGSVILQAGDHHYASNDDVCLDHLNRVNRVPLMVNPDTARMIANEWRNLDRQKPDEAYHEYQDRVAAFTRYDRSARDVMELLFITGNRFYLTHRYDKRGRTYAQGYHVNPQGTPWNKAVVEFADQEIVEHS